MVSDVDRGIANIVGGIQGFAQAKERQEEKKETARQRALQNQQRQFDNNLKIMSTIQGFDKQGYEVAPIADYLQRQQAGLSGVKTPEQLTEEKSMQGIQEGTDVMPEAGEYDLQVKEPGLADIFKKRPGNANTLDQQIKQAQLKKLNQDIALKGQSFEKKKKEASLILTPGEKKIDQDYAQNFNKFIVKGGFADAQKGIGELEEIITQLGKSDDISGPLIGNLPGKEIFYPKSKDVQERVESIVQRSLKEILGAQFGEKEGDRLISRAYNPKLQEGLNSKRLQKLLKATKIALESQKSAAEYFKKNGSLKGFEGKINMDVDEIDESVAQGVPAGLSPIKPTNNAPGNQFNIFGQALPQAQAGQQTPLAPGVNNLPPEKQARIQELLNK